MRNSNKFDSNINWVCFDCGQKALKNPVNKGKKQFRVSTCHKGLCDICHRIKSVTEVRDFNYPTFE